MANTKTYSTGGSGQADLKALLDQLYFLTPERKGEILKQCEGAPEQAITQMLAILRQAVAHQDSLLRERLRKDPDFAKNLETFLHNSLKEIRPIAERVERAGSDQQFRNLS